ncbi:ABC transporter ATP-binding protein [Desulforhopalus sp. IMCC35007]|uniref:ABC transporter ATP-binding protein n=1 Tax=Desulforhopalus sp. IMCC35007 TaxID=2569543 RepID=UPI0010AEB61A|nr:ABC transporter ATP-binding protein [Desulforhopalus sp. IMCC35007]TKB08328.1 ABC transporter ATP-binding protein [Desulforhopalus sp. IMCC35007]
MDALSISDLHKVYNSGFIALKGVTFDVKEGDFFGLLGPNGAGKTTTIGILTSLVTKTKGTVTIFGIDIDKDFPAAKRLIGVVPQEYNFSIFEKVIDIVTQQAGYYGMEKDHAYANAEKYLKKLGLWEKRHSPARELSGGMKRRLMIARGLIHEPRLLILDEPTAGVDVELRRGMWDFLTELNEKGTTIILTTHYLEEAEQLCKQIAIINHGQIIVNTSKKALLRKLNKETFIFETKEPVIELPPLGESHFRIQEETTVEITIDKHLSLNAIFAHLNRHNITVESMRNKSNRLEELFMELVEQ